LVSRQALHPFDARRNLFEGRKNSCARIPSGKVTSRISNPSWQCEGVLGVVDPVVRALKENCKESSRSPSFSFMITPKSHGDEESYYHEQG
jgi:hypothetical protein